MSPTPIPTQCEGCSSKFSWLRKRRTCLMCRSVCCSSCMQRLRLCGVGRQCLRCARLAGVRYERAALQQMTVRDLKHIMKIVDVSSATCREKSDLVDTILMCSESGGRSGSPAVEAAVSPSTAAPAAAPAAAAHRPWRVRPGDSIRVGPLESIRVRAMDGAESPLSSEESPAPDRSSGGSSSSATLSCEESDDGFVMVDVETSGDGADGGDDAVRSVEVDAAADRPVEVDVEGFVETERLSNVEADAPMNLGLTVDGSSAVETASASDDEVIVDDDPDEPQSESVTIEVDKDDDENGIDPVSETDADLSRVTDVAQIPSEDLISRLTVRQCKQLLQHRRTDYRNVIEKEELLRRVRELWRETKRNSEALASAPDRDICKICMDSLVDCVMLECGHMATCTACGKQMSECPICRKYVVRVVHVFRS